MIEHHSDTGTVLQPDEYAAVWSPRNEYSFLASTNESVPDEASALMAAVIRLEVDPIFRAECVDWLYKRRQ
jgi:hypothetical protein